MESISTKDTRITLEYLQNHNEDQYFERKGLGEELLKPSKLANEIIGMLNADGGVIAFGIANDGTIQNLDTIGSTLDEYRKVPFDFIKPPANVFLEEVRLASGELIFLYHVDQDYERMFCRKDNEDVYIRVGDSNKGPLNRDEVRKLEYDKMIRQFEDEPREDFDPADLRQTVIDFYSKKLNFKGTTEDLLITRKLALKKNDNIVYKNSAILLFSEDPDKYIASSFVRYIRYNGIEAKSGGEYNVVKDEVFNGCIPRQIEFWKRFIYTSLKDYYYLDMTLGKFIKISEYPEEAWLEGIVNALCHRSYNIQGNCIYIKHFDDRLEISNSGPLPSQVTVENIRTERFSRNPRIARVLSDFGYVRELNEGVSRIYESMEKSMLADPVYLDKNNTVILVLKGKVYDHEKSITEKVMKKVETVFTKLNPTEQLILEYLFRHNQSTVKELAVEMKKSEKVIREYLNRFLELEILYRKSSKQRDKNAIYCFKRD